jgi:hypothetical protein
MFDYLRVCELVNGIDVNSGLAAFAAAAKIEDELAELRKANLKLANEQFLAMSPADRKKRHYGVLFKQYTAPAQYEWPQAVVEAEAKLKDAKALAKADKSAKQIKPPELDLAVDRTFSVQVLDEPRIDESNVEAIMAGAMVYVEAKQQKKGTAQ